MWSIKILCGKNIENTDHALCVKKSLAIVRAIPNSFVGKDANNISAKWPSH